MQALRLNEVLARVVAWHNRHPLARRINPTQVHSIGAVVLPFASDTPADAPSAAAAPGHGLAMAARPLTVSELLDVLPAAVAPPLRQATPAAAAGLTAETAAEVEDADADVDVDVDVDAAADADADAEALAAARADAVAQPLPARLPAPAAAAATPSSPAHPAASPAADDPFALAEADMATEAAAQAAAALAPAQANAADLARDAAADSADDRADNSADNTAADTAADTASATGQPSAADRVDLALSLTPPQPAAPPSHACTPSADADAHPHADDSPATTPPVAPAATAAAAPPAAAPNTTSGRGWWQRLLARLRSSAPALARLQPVFSRSFVWPLRSSHVARWARRHGQVQPMAPADWPQRVVQVDAPLRAAARQRGLARDVHLHLLTAAIGVGDRRIRVLIGADGQILGPRAYSRSRVAAAAAVLALAAAAACGWAMRRPAAVVPDALALPALAAVADLSVAAAAASASAASAPVAVPAASAALAAAATADAHAAAPAPVLDHAASAAAATLGPALPAGQAADPAASVATAAQSPAARGSPAGTDAATTPTADAAAKLPVLPSLKAAKRAQAPWMASAGSAPLGRIRPSLADDERQAARQHAAALRGAAPDADSHSGPASAAASAPARPPVFAVVVRPRRFRQTAADDLKVLKNAATKLSGLAPTHGELLNKDGAWHAAWWPFENEADAERARVLLAGRGLKADVVGF